LRAQINKLVPEQMSIRPVPLAHFKAVPPAPTETIRAINSYDDKQFIEYARKLFGPIVNATNTELHPFSPKGMAQLKTKENALREAESLPPELIVKLQKAFTDWQNNSPPEAGSYSINPRSSYHAQQAAQMEKMTLNEQRAKNREMAARSMAAAREHDKAMERQRAQRQAVPPNVMQSGLHWYPKP
jgi:hypothetical protein